MNGWVRVEDGLPEESGHVWVVTDPPCIPHRVILVQYADGHIRPWREADNEEYPFYGRVTHWHPLAVPEPPAGE